MQTIERLNAQKTSPLWGVHILHWNHSPQLQDNVPHRHTFYEICLVGRSGSALWSIGNTQTRISSGDVLLARPGDIHQISQTRNLELFWVTFSVDGTSYNSVIEAEIASLWRAFEDADCTLGRDSGSLFSLWQALHHVAGSEEIAGKSAQISALQSAILLSIAQIGAGEGAPVSVAPQSDAHSTARLAARYLQDNLARKICLAEVAAHVHLSPRHLNRVFRQFTGVTPAAYLETTRLDRARYLLRATDRPIKEIATLVGIEDVHYFSRLFSKRNGVPPAQFRRDIAGDVHIIHKDGALV